MLPLHDDNAHCHHTERIVLSTRDDGAQACLNYLQWAHDGTQLAGRLLAPDMSGSALCADPFANDTANDSGSSKDYIHIRIQQRNGRKSLTTVQVCCLLWMA
jgi:hypothetical protein